ncbi:MAG: hypothetical protein QOI00_574 [Chloroflexota bacterium]|nr:hypothetical protein [Chloroflexota bacterium]
MNHTAGSDPGRPATPPEPLGSSTGSPNDRPARPIELWTPRGIGWASVLLGFPGAIVLAALNWHRMDMPRKAVLHVAAAVVGTWALFLVNAGSVGLAVGLAVGFYLNRAQRADQSPFSAAGLVIERSGLVGAVLALVTSVVIVGISALIATALGVGGVAHRGDVLFGSGVTADVCSPAGQATVFGQSDPIFVAAVMRETVQPGSQVVFEIDAPSDKVGPLPVTVQPPFDCLGSKESIGPLEPGTYIVRYRYDGQSGTAELAYGTFTITESPAGPADSPP